MFSYGTTVKRQSLFVEKYLWIFFLIFQKMHIEMHVFLILRIQFIIGFYKLAVLIRYGITAAMEKFVQRNMVIAAELDCCIKIRKPSAGLIAGIYLSGDRSSLLMCCLRKSWHDAWRSFRTALIVRSSISYLFCI